MPEVRGPMYSRKALPEFFRGVSLSTIDKWMKEYLIPRRGPNKKLFAQSDLEAFVEDPEAFKIKRRSKAAKKITVDEVWGDR